MGYFTRDALDAYATFAMRLYEPEFLPTLRLKADYHANNGVGTVCDMSLLWLFYEQIRGQSKYKLPAVPAGLTACDCKAPRNGKRSVATHTPLL